MIFIVRLRPQENKENICDYIISQKEDLQKAILGKGRLLYLTKLARHEDVSLFIHTVDPDFLGDFIADHLSRIEHITSAWVINLIKPIFFPLPKDTRNMKRHVVTLKVFPKNLKTIYQSIATGTLPQGLKLAYLAYTCHLFGDCIQFSILAEDDEILDIFLSEVVKKIPGVLRITNNFVEKTRPLISYTDWKQYSLKHGIVPSWNEESMIEQFQ